MDYSKTRVLWVTLYSLGDLLAVRPLPFESLTRCGPATEPGSSCNLATFFLLCQVGLFNLLNE